MQNISKLCLILCCVLFTGNISAQSSWAGSYEFGEDGGKNAGGTTIFISHQLDVTDTGDGLIATLQSNGYQTSKDLQCTAKIDGKKLLIYFESYGENNIFETYKKGDLLLTLEEKIEKGKPVLITYWGAFLPIVPKNEKTGKVYFNRTETTLYED